MFCAANYVEGENVEVYNPTHKKWYKGVVQKVCKKTIKVFYESDNTYTQHKKKELSGDNIRRLDNLSDEDTDDDEPFASILNTK